MKFSARRVQGWNKQFVRDKYQWPSRPIRSLRYIATCTRIRDLQAWPLKFERVTRALSWNKNVCFIFLVYLYNSNKNGLDLSWLLSAARSSGKSETLNPCSLGFAGQVSPRRFPAYKSSIYRERGKKWTGDGGVLIFWRRGTHTGWPVTLLFIQTPVILYIISYILCNVVSVYCVLFAYMSQPLVYSGMTT